MSALVIGNALPPVPPAGFCSVGVQTSNNTSDWDSYLSDASASTAAYWGEFTSDNGSVSGIVTEAAALPVGGLHLGWSFPGSIDLEHVAGGTDDAYITTCAEALAAYGKPVLARMNWEMQGDYSTYSAWTSGGTVIPGNSPAYYIAAWQHTVTMVRAIAPNVAFVWAPSVFPPSYDSPAYTVTSWYPGAAYVDWHGMIVYPGTASWSYLTNDTTWGMTLAYAHAVSNGRPLMICEWGIGINTGDNTIYINQLLDWVQNNPQCKCISYFDFDNTSASTNAVDFRLFNYPDSRSVYRARITGGSRYLT